MTPYRERGEKVEGAWGEKDMNEIEESCGGSDPAKRRTLVVGEVT